MNESIYKFYEAIYTNIHCIDVFNLSRPSDAYMRQ